MRWRLKFGQGVTLIQSIPMGGMTTRQRYSVEFKGQGREEDETTSPSPITSNAAVNLQKFQSTMQSIRQIRILAGPGNHQLVD